MATKVDQKYDVLAFECYADWDDGDDPGAWYVISGSDGKTIEQSDTFETCAERNHALAKRLAELGKPNCRCIDITYKD